MTNIRYVCFLLILSFFVGACGGGSSDPDPAPVEKEDLLIKTWRINEELLNGTSSSTNNSQYRITYNKDGSYREVNIQGSSSNGTWEFTNNNNTIVYDKNTSTERQEAITLTETTLDRSFTMENYKSGNVTVLLKMVPVP